MSQLHSLVEIWWPFCLYLTKSIKYTQVDWKPCELTNHALIEASLIHADTTATNKWVSSINRWRYLGRKMFLCIPNQVPTPSNIHKSINPIMAGSSDQLTTLRSFEEISLECFRNTSKHPGAAATLAGRSDQNRQRNIPSNWQKYLRLTLISSTHAWRLKLLYSNSLNCTPLESPRVALALFSLSSLRPGEIGSTSNTALSTTVHSQLQATPSLSMTIIFTRSE